MLDLPIRSYRRLPAGRASMRLIRTIYRLTSHFPSDEKSGLTATLRKSATGLLPRIAGGGARDAEAVAGVQSALHELNVYLDVAESLRMASRWRLRKSRRAVRTLSHRLERLSADAHGHPVCEAA